MIVFVSSGATGKVTQHGWLAGNDRRKGTGLITEKILGFKVKWAGPMASYVMDRSWTFRDAWEARASTRRPPVHGRRRVVHPNKAESSPVSCMTAARACIRGRSTDVPLGGSRKRSIGAARVSAWPYQREAVNITFWKRGIFIATLFGKQIRS